MTHGRGNQRVADDHRGKPVHHHEDDRKEDGLEDWLAKGEDWKPEDDANDDARLYSDWPKGDSLFGRPELALGFWKYEMQKAN